MCLLLFAYKTHPKYKLILVANRDEFYNRSTQEAHFWKENTDVLAGKDLVAGGTWLGINKKGYFSALTNFRDGTNNNQNALSRGNLTKNYLLNGGDPLSYLFRTQFQATKYNGFNLLVADKDNLMYYSNQEKIIKTLHSGVYGLSNHLLDTEWGKLTRGKEKLSGYIKNKDLDTTSLLNFMNDTTPASVLPNTGVPIEWEKMLSPMFIKSPKYGTRCSTAILWDYEDNIIFEERNYIIDKINSNILDNDILNNNISFDFYDKKFNCKQ